MKRHWKIVLGIMVLIGLPVGWYLGSPLFINKEVREEFPMKMPNPHDVDGMSREQKLEMEPKIAADLAGMPKRESMEEMPAEKGPSLVAEGMFRNVDTIHRGNGKAQLFQFAEGASLLRLEEIDIANGPDLWVYLVKHPDPKNAEDVKAGFVNLGKLKGNRGSQNYSIPAEIKTEEYGSAVIFCQLFGVLFSPAPLKMVK